MMVDEGALLVRIDPTDYELEVERLEAEVGVLEALGGGGGAGPEKR